MRKMSGYVPTDLKIHDWKDIKPYFEKLITEEINSVQDLELYLVHFSDVLSVFHEQQARIYINATCHTNNEDYQNLLEKFTSQIIPQADKANNEIQKKIIANPFFTKLPEERYLQFKKELKRELELFREANVELESQLNSLSTKYTQLIGALTVDFRGETLTLPQANAHLESSDRQERLEVWQLVMNERQQAKSKITKIFDEMLSLRHQVAQNAGYKNYRDYKHDEFLRFDYSVDDVLEFHRSIQKHVLPLIKKIELKHIEKLNLQKADYRPWDCKAKPKGFNPLKPYQNVRELLEKTFSVFHHVRPEFAENLKKMNHAELFDLESRPHKAPGGYNYGLEVTGMPFIFMNAAGTHTDVVTLMHEGGHAMHTFLVSPEPLIQYRNCPLEISEVASMGMELITSQSWYAFYQKEDHLRARIEHLEDVVSTFAWVGVIDSFQHWLYTHPSHSAEERNLAFDRIFQEFSTGSVNWEGYELFRSNQWQKQGHVFDVPFYYIEYAISQLGALQVYRNYRTDPEQAIQNYINALRLGGSKPIPDVWQTMGIKFDFSEDTLKDLMMFVENELFALYQLSS